MSVCKNPYIKHNRRTDTYSVYAIVNGKRKVIARVASESIAIQIREDAKDGIIQTSKYNIVDDKPQP